MKFTVKVYKSETGFSAFLEGGRDKKFLIYASFYNEIERKVALTRMNAELNAYNNFCLAAGLDCDFDDEELK